MSRRIGFALALAFWGQGLAAEGVGLGVAALSEDRRLLAFALTQARPAGWQASVGRVAGAEGLSGALRGPRFSVSPGIGWDDNVNGGIQAETIGLGGMTFTVDPESRAVGDLVASLGLGVSQVVPLAPGHGLTATASLSAGKALDHDLWVIRRSLGLCSANDLGSWTFLDLCLREDQVQRDLGDSDVASASMRLSRVFGDAQRVQRLALRLGQEVAEAQARGTLRLDWEVAEVGLGLVSASVEWGERPEGRQVPVARQTLAFRRSLAGAPMGLVLEHRQEAGEEIFGRPREEEVWSISAERWLKKGMRLKVGYETRSSSIEGFGGEAVNLALDFPGFSF